MQKSVSIPYQIILYEQGKSGYNVTREKRQKSYPVAEGKQNKTKQWTVSKPTNKFYGPEKAT